MNKITEQRLASYDANTAAARTIFARKNEEYGDAIRFGGVLSAAYEITGAAMRLPALIFFSQDHGRSKAAKLYDVFLDIINYANIALQMMKDNNWEGRF